MWRCLKIIDCQNGGLERFGKANLIIARPRNHGSCCLEHGCSGVFRAARYMVSACFSETMHVFRYLFCSLLRNIVPYWRTNIWNKTHQASKFPLSCQVVYPNSRKLRHAKTPQVSETTNMLCRNFRKWEWDQTQSYILEPDPQNLAIIAYPAGHH